MLTTTLSNSEMFSTLRTKIDNITSFRQFKTDCWNEFHNNLRYKMGQFLYVTI